MTPLIVATDLQARGIDTTNSTRIAALIAAATDAINAAAGCPILASQVTFSRGGVREQWLPLDMQPVRSVTSVKLDDVAVSDFRVIDGRLWRACGWQPTVEPSVVEVTGMFGYDTVPADIVDLACALVAGALASAEDANYDPERGITTVRIDDYSDTRATGGEEIISPMQLTDATRAWLRSRFSTQSYVIGAF